MASMVGMMVGQCGNQIGAAAYGALHAERPLPGERALFDEGGHARAVLVDGEAKVIGALFREAGGPFSRANAFAEDSGRGNNWALGYYGPRAGNRIVDRAMEALRRQLEASDAYRGGMIFHSLCGGTGAGLGSRMMEEMRDELAASPLVSTTVLPFAVGELPLQHYNATLCLSRVIKEPAACLLFSNNDLLSLCAKRNAAKPGSTTVRPADAAAATVRTKQINDYIGLALASVLRPCVFSRQPRGRTAVPWDMAGSIAALAPTPETKFLEIWAVQESSKRRMGGAPPWASLGDRLAGEIPRFRHQATCGDASSENAICKILAGGYQVFARGATVFGGEGTEERLGALSARAALLKTLDLNLTQQVHEPANAPLHAAASSENFAKFTSNCTWICCPEQVAAAHPRSLSVLTCRTGHIAHMELILERCERMAASGAYLHWFRKYGFEDQELHLALEDLRVYLGDASDFFEGRGVT
eukprot:Tamp_14311.p1 GENE.Tamp_14311~~Tamp_14311.p1  ORF type:complete len:473 (-),score=83.66 Tamp_14311:101-1519(-)